MKAEMASSGSFFLKRIPLLFLIVLVAFGLAMRIERNLISRSAYTVGAVESKNPVAVPPNRPAVVVNGEEMIPLRHPEVTLVTAYYDFSSAKRSSNKYDAWIENMMTLRDNMIIFLPPHQVDRFQQLRDKNNRTANTVIIELSMNDTTLYNRYGGMEYWDTQHQIDPNKHLHVNEHYVVWNEKSEFVRRAMDLNPFDSIFFAWVDVGYLRTDDFVNQRLVRFVPKSLKADQALLLHTGNTNWGIGGGFIGGYKDGQAKWNEKYYQVLDLAHNTSFIGMDQPWMRKTCDQHINLCREVTWKNSFGDAWFYMAPYLHGMGQPDQEE